MIPSFSDACSGNYVIPTKVGIQVSRGIRAELGKQL